MEKVLAILIPVFAIQLVVSAAMDVDLLNPDCSLRGYMEILESKNPVKSDFIELRSNPFQRRARRFEGSIYWHPDHGLSLEYRSPVLTRINVDAETITIHKPGDEPRQLQVTSENPVLGMFLNLFDWDTQWIATNFVTEAEFSESSVQLSLKPVAETIRIRLNRIILTISDNVLSSIELDLSGQKEVLIQLTKQEVPWNPDAATLSSRFSTTNEGK